MKSDLDRLMAERDLDAIIVYAHETYSAALDYLAGGARITGGMAIKPRDHAPVLIVNPMETEEAAVSGLQIYTNAEIGFYDLLKEEEGDVVRATVRYWGQALRRVGVERGTIGIYGTAEIHRLIALTRLLEEAYPEYTFQGEMGVTLFDEAALTKDADEIARLQSVADRTNAVLAATWHFLAMHRAEGDAVVNASGEPLTIGAVKRFIRRELMDRDLEDTGMIFAQGRDAGFPHSRGNEQAVLKPGESIVFDLFPREIGGGYHHDVTRTWCLGYAPDDVRAAYDDVITALDIAYETYALNKPTHLMQEAVLDYFEGKGHPTTRSEPGTQAGYVHSLGHGIGLNIHEGPRISHLTKEDVFAVGNVVTIEPGLYYPERGFGVRVEDALYVDENGELVMLTDFRKDLVLPLEG